MDNKCPGSGNKPTKQGLCPVCSRSIMARGNLMNKAMLPHGSGPKPRRNPRTDRTA